MNNYAVIFDMDGVIVDTNPFHSEAFRAFFDKHKVAYTEDDFVNHMYGKHNSYIMNYFFKRAVDAAELKELEDEKEELFREIYVSQVNAIAGLIPFIAALRAQGLQTAVATSAPKANLDLIIDKLNLRPQMDSLLSSEHVSKHKPDPEVYLKTAQQLHTVPGQCLVFEDSFSGVSAAINAGMQVVGVLTSHKKEELPPCQYYIHNYHEITAADAVSLLKK